MPIVRSRDVRHVENGTLHPLDRKTSAILTVVVVVAVFAGTCFLPYPDLFWLLWIALLLALNLQMLETCFAENLALLRRQRLTSIAAAMLRTLCVAEIFARSKQQHSFTTGGCEQS